MNSNAVIRFLILTGAAAGVLCAATVRTAVAAPVTYTIDPAFSAMAVSGPATTNVGPLTGEIVADLAGGGLTGGSSISGVGPFSGSAGYSTTATSGSLEVEVSGTANVVYSNFTFGLFGGPISSGGNVAGLSLQPLTGHMEGTTTPTVTTTFRLPLVPPVSTTVTLGAVTFSADYAGNSPLGLKSGMIDLTDDGIIESLHLEFLSDFYDGDLTIDAIDFGGLGSDFEALVESALTAMIVPFASVSFVSELTATRPLTTAVAVPEPGSLAMFALGLLGFGFLRCKRAA